MYEEDDLTGMKIASIASSISGIASHLDQFETFVGAISTSTREAGRDIARDISSIADGLNRVDSSIDRVAEALEGILEFLKSDAKKR